METEKFKKKKAPSSLIAVVIAILLLAGVILFINKSKKTPSKAPTDVTNQEIIPTVNPSVKVDLRSVNGGKQVTLSVDNMPLSTQTMEYTIDYKAKNREGPGIFSSAALKPGETSWEKTFDVGTCSSGKCIFDDVIDNKMKVTLKFTGAYGDRLFEKEFSL